MQRMTPLEPELEISFLSYVVGEDLQAVAVYFPMHISSNSSYE